MSSLKDQWRYQFTARRWALFFRSRLWLGLPAMALLAFLGILLIGLCGGIELDQLLKCCFREGVLCAIVYIFGMVITTAKTPEEILAEREQEEKEAEEYVGRMSRLSALFGVLFGVLFLLSLFSLPSLVEMWRGDAPRVEVMAKMVGDALAGLSLVAPQVVDRVMNR